MLVLLWTVHQPWFPHITVWFPRSVNKMCHKLPSISYTLHLLHKPYFLRHHASLHSTHQHSSLNSSIQMRLTGAEKATAVLRNMPPCSLVDTCCFHYQYRTVRQVEKEVSDVGKEGKGWGPTADQWEEPELNGILWP
jgi:hypothetical protein